MGKRTKTTQKADPGEYVGVNEVAQGEQASEQALAVAAEADLSECDEVEVALDSLEANVGYGSLLRELQHAYIERVAFLRSKAGGSLPPDEARAHAYHACRDKGEAKRIYEKLMSLPLDDLDFVDLYEMWPAAPRLAEQMWEKIKEEGGDRFMSGHMATEAMYPESYMRTAWNVASYLGLRESFVAEWKPRGGIELSLIDMLAQSFILYQYWVKQSVLRAETRARDENPEYTRWKADKKAAGWLHGYWDVPYVHEQGAVEHAAQMADRWNRIYMRTLRNLRDLRRYSSAVIVNNPQQVNIAADGGQQINISEQQE